MPTATSVYVFVAVVVAEHPSWPAEHPSTVDAALSAAYPALVVAGRVVVSPWTWIASTPSGAELVPVPTPVDVACTGITSVSVV